MTQEQQRQRWAAIRDIADRQGLALIRFSARRYIVVSLERGGGFYGVPTGNAGLKYITHHGGTLMFGPASRDECQQYIAQTVEALPRELVAF